MRKICENYCSVLPSQVPTAFLADCSSNQCVVTVFARVKNSTPSPIEMPPAALAVKLWLTNALAPMETCRPMSIVNGGRKLAFCPSGFCSSSASFSYSELFCPFRLKPLLFSLSVYRIPSYINIRFLISVFSKSVIPSLQISIFLHCISYIKYAASSIHICRTILYGINCILYPSRNEVIFHEPIYHTLHDRRLAFAAAADVFHSGAAGATCFSSCTR